MKVLCALILLIVTDLAIADWAIRIDYDTQGNEVKVRTFHCPVRPVIRGREVFCMKSFHDYRYVVMAPNHALITVIEVEDVQER